MKLFVVRTYAHCFKKKNSGLIILLCFLVSTQEQSLPHLQVHRKFN